MRWLLLGLSVSGCGPTPSQAAHDLDLVAVRRLITVGKVDPNRRDAAGVTPLQAAMIAYPTWDRRPVPPAMRPIAEFLLAHGADPNLSFMYGDVAGITVLHVVAYDGKKHLVSLLVEAGAKVNAKDARGYTPLHVAAHCDFRLSYDSWAADTIEYLVAHGADPRAKGNQGETPLDRVPTPCAQRRCTSDELAGGWPSGTCKQTYLTLRRLAGE